MSHREPNQVLRTLRCGLNIASALVTAIVVMTGAWLLLGPLPCSTAESTRRLETLQALLGDERRLRAEHSKLRQQLEQATQEKALIQKRIPDEPHEADFLAQVSHAAGEVGLQITDYRPGVMSAGKAPSTLRVELTGEGSYRAICTFLDRLRELPRYSMIARLDIERDASSEHYLVKLCLELYFFSDSRKLAAK